MSILIALAAAALAVPTVTPAGSCPGPMTITFDGLTPGGQFVVLGSAGLGSTLLPGGPCAGVDTGLAAPLMWVAPITDLDADGIAVLSPTVPGPACGNFVTVLDMTTCEVAIPVSLSAGGGGPCDLVGGVNTDDAFNDAVSAGGVPVAMKYVPPADASVNRVEIFTGEESGDNSVALWSHDPGADQPAVMLASGSWAMSDINGWQGADLDATVALTGGETYWVVWEPIGGAQWTQAADVPGTADVDYKATFDGYSSWDGPWTEAYKHKLFSCD
ncbi:MAG: hypothetical protein ACI8PZ_004552 [Myxococcota bacterium]|jgi:hypothetical protein